MSSDRIKELVTTYWHLVVAGVSGLVFAGTLYAQLSAVSADVDRHETTIHSIQDRVDAKLDKIIDEQKIQFGLQQHSIVKIEEIDKRIERIEKRVK